LGWRVNEDEFKKNYYSEAEIAEILGLELSTMRSRITRRSNCPPFWSPKRGLYYFPKGEFIDWCRAQGLTYEVQSAS
jgi:hypothetical protein